MIKLILQILSAIATVLLLLAAPTLYNRYRLEDRVSLDLNYHSERTDQVGPWILEHIFWIVGIAVIASGVLICFLLAERQQLREVSSHVRVRHRRHHPR
jgi:hypothetical protein